MNQDDNDPLRKIDAALKSVRREIDDLGKLDRALDRQLDDIDARVTRLERERAATPGVVPDAWKAAITNPDTSLTLQ
jgi:hypothetical protein